VGRGRRNKKAINYQEKPSMSPPPLEGPNGEITQPVKKLVPKKLDFSKYSYNHQATQQASPNQNPLSNRMMPVPQQKVYPKRIIEKKKEVV
jgi:hypothetical protein